MPAIAFYIALTVYIAVGVLVLLRRKARGRVPVARIATDAQPETEAVPVALAPEPAETTPRSAHGLQTLVARLHQRELAAEYRALSGKVDDAVVDLPSVEASERAWHDRHELVAEMHERELVAEHRAFARGPEH